MNTKIKLLLIILVIFLLLFLIVKPYSYFYSSNCYPYPSGGLDSGWCIGFIYPINQTIQKTRDQNSIQNTSINNICFDRKNGFECKGISIFKSEAVIS